MRYIYMEGTYPTCLLRKADNHSAPNKSQAGNSRCKVPLISAVALPRCSCGAKSRVSMRAYICRPCGFWLWSLNSATHTRTTFLGTHNEDQAPRPNFSQFYSLKIRGLAFSSYTNSLIAGSWGSKNVKCSVRSVLYRALHRAGVVVVPVP